MMDVGFRDLWHSFFEYQGHRLFDDVLSPFVPNARHILKDLGRYRRLNSPDNPYDVDNADLWAWYALSRVNDYFLMSFQTSESFSSASRPAAQTRHAYGPWNEKTLTHDEYEAFFETLGFSVFTRCSYTPFHCEIVEVVEDARLDKDVEIDHVFWPGVMFGEMLFSRAGVRVRCRPGVFDKQVAENSILYFTFSRHHRRTVDLSHGWGSNSQWGTDFRRDYETTDHFHFNVDSVREECIVHVAHGDSPFRKKERAWYVFEEELFGGGRYR